MTIFSNEPPQPAPREIPVPFLPQSIGLGDAIKNVTRAFGVQPCNPCEQRAQALNQRFTLRPWGSQD